MYKVISMFSGAGGLDMGFHNKGFRVLWANDFNKDACDTYDKWANYKDGERKPENECTVVACGDISKINFEEIAPGETIDVVLGGFPCQGFSVAGPRQVDDSRNILYRHFVEMVRVKNPKVFVAENVPGLLTLGDGSVFDKIQEDFSSLGYTLSASIVNAKDYGVPQDRVRVIIIGIRNDICRDENGKCGAFSFPKGNSKVVTLQEALKDFSSVDMADVCQSSFSPRYMSRNRKREFAEVSFTIPAMAKQVPLSPDSAGMIYVDVDKFDFREGINRRLSYKEAAAIQTFPKDMYFSGDLDSKYKQIGNAVPVKLAEKIAEEVEKILNEDKDLSSLLNYEDPLDEIRVDKRITPSDVNNKAFEYASLETIKSELLELGWSEAQIDIVSDENYLNDKIAFDIITGENELEKRSVASDDFNRAAKTAAHFLCSVEPVLKKSEGLRVVLSIMPNKAKLKGDIRDLSLRIEQMEQPETTIKEIGISCKNNHEATKHPRITENPDFANEWTKGRFKCSDDFLKQMSEIQSLIEVKQNKCETWAEVDDKMDTIYYPIVQAFVTEIRRLGIVEPNASDEEIQRAGEFAKAFYEYMLGTRDFYRFIKSDKEKATIIYIFNMYGTLMDSYKGEKNKPVVPYVSLPKKIVDVRVKPNSKTTLEIYFDQGMYITMRLHNADTRIKKTSLKFDVQLKEQPKSVLANKCLWK